MAMNTHRLVPRFAGILVILLQLLVCSKNSTVGLTVSQAADMIINLSYGRDGKIKTKITATATTLVV